MSSKKVSAFIQARMGSSRFPGKMIEKLDNNNILEWVVKRTSKSKLINEIVLLTSDMPSNNVLISIAKKLEIKTFRGSENNVLNRFANAAKLFNSDILVRICADNPFIDGKEIDRLIKYFFKNKYDYCFNNQNKLGNNYADGFGAEIITNKLLQFLENNVVSEEEREHVTLALFNKKFENKISGLKAPKDLSFPEMRFDVDTKEDLIKLKRLINNGVNIDSSASEIIKINKLIN